MSKTKLVLSILIFIFLVILAVILPQGWKKSSGKAADSPGTEESMPVPAHEDGNGDGETDLGPEYHGFESLDDFLAAAQRVTLEEQLATYLALELPWITDVTFLPERSAYPDENSTELAFRLSDGSELPVFYYIKSGTFAFSEEKVFFTQEPVIYEKETNDSLPAYSTEEIEQMDEGGYPDTGTAAAQESGVQP